MLKKEVRYSMDSKNSSIWTATVAATSSREMVNSYNFMHTKGLSTLVQMLICINARPDKAHYNACGICPHYTKTKSHPTPSKTMLNAWADKRNAN